MNKLLKYLFFALLLSSCKFECKLGSSAKDSSTVNTSTKKVGDATVTNNINITSNTTNLTYATLLLENREQVSDDNVINLNENIYLVLKFDDTWKVIDGKCRFGASEKIVTDDGTIMLNAADLFKDYPDGISEEDAKHGIQLSAIVTKRGESVKHYTVYFEVWDKNGPARLTGNYRFYIKD